MRQIANTKGILPRILTDLMGKTLGERVLSGPPVNIINRDEGYTIELVVPGYDKSDFSIEADEEVLEISADKEVDLHPEKGQLIIHEYLPSAFSRSFEFSEDAVKEGLRATYSNGILRVFIPKRNDQEGNERKRIPVE